jgi:hypothetical protein
MERLTTTVQRQCNDNDHANNNATNNATNNANSPRKAVQARTLPNKPGILVSGRLSSKAIESNASFRFAA